jgi:hypothetical protein
VQTRGEYGKKEENRKEILFLNIFFSLFVCVSCPPDTPVCKAANGQAACRVTDSDVM